MEGYDLCLLSNFYAMPQFNEKYGEQLPDGTWQVPAPWQAGLSNGAYVGEIIGLFINGYVSERFGYRYTVMTCLTLIIAFTAIFFTAKDVIALQVAEVLCGIPWGVFQTLTITYASECCPVALRGYREYIWNFHFVAISPFSIFPRTNRPELTKLSPSHHLCQLLLGAWSAYRCWRYQSNASPQR